MHIPACKKAHAHKFRHAHAHPGNRLAALINVAEVDTSVIPTPSALQRHTDLVAHQRVGDSCLQADEARCGYRLVREELGGEDQHRRSYTRRSAQKE
eukprot:364308-Chlamydomonas_euryale.AAC.15